MEAIVKVKSILISSVGRLALALALTLATGATLAQTGAALGQAGARLRLESLDHLQSRAVERVNVSVDANLLQLAVKILSDGDPDERNIKELVADLKGVYVRSYEFKSEGQYADSDLAPLRAQLSAPVWSPVVEVETGDGGKSDTKVYVASEGGKVEGLAILVTEPKKLTVVNIVGAIDFEKLRKLEGSLGIPKISIKTKDVKIEKAPGKEKP